MTDNSTEILVEGTQPYAVTVGRGNRFSLADAIGDDATKVLIVHQPTLATAAAELREALSDRYQVLLAEVPDGEAAKRVEVASFCWQIMGQADFTRTDAVVGFGGGAATDLAGFVAATWLRGVRLIQVPTTLLGMVDASVGGKTGINTTEGKNLVGSFYAPAAVIADLDALTSLPRNEIVSGLAEVVKCGFIADPAILDIIEADVDAASNPDTTEVRDLIERSIRVKAEVVSQDFKESGLREILNYGHTLGHAIEYAERYQWRHGAAVSIGLVYAAELARMSGRLSDAVADRHRSILESLGLPTSYPVRRWDSLLTAMHRDKKARGAMLRFIVLEDLARPIAITAPEPSVMFAAYQEIAS